MPEEEELQISEHKSSSVINAKKVNNYFDNYMDDQIYQADHHKNEKDDLQYRPVVTNEIDDELIPQPSNTNLGGDFNNEYT